MRRKIKKGPYSYACQHIRYFSADIRYVFQWDKRFNYGKYTGTLYMIRYIDKMDMLQRMHIEVHVGSYTQ